VRRLLCLLAGVAVAAATAEPTLASYGAAPQRKIIISAHRGGAAYAPENTMVAFRNAVRLGVDQVETDTQLTKDGKLVLIHDDSLDRTTNCHGAVKDHTYAEIRRCDAAYWFTPGQGTTTPDAHARHPLRGTGVQVPLAATLFSYVRSMERPRPTISIEIKDIPGEANFDVTANATATKLVALIHRSGLRNTIVQSFWPPALTSVELLDPAIRTQLLTQTTMTYASVFSAVFRFDIVAPDSGSPDLSSGSVTAAHAAGKLVIVWTPDTRADQQAAMATGADGVISNWPACALDIEHRGHPKAGFGLPDCPRS